MYPPVQSSHTILPAPFACFGWSNWVDPTSFQNELKLELYGRSKDGSLSLQRPKTPNTPKPVGPGQRWLAHRRVTGPGGREGRSRGTDSSPAPNGWIRIDGRHGWIWIDHGSLSKLNRPNGSLRELVRLGGCCILLEGSSGVRGHFVTWSLPLSLDHPWSALF